MSKTRLALAATTVCALLLGAAAPAAAQEEEPLELDLGLAVDKTEGPPGALVLTKANAADVAEHCVTDLEEFQARFEELHSERLGGVIFGDPGPLFDIFFPDGIGDDGAESHEQVAFAFLALLALGLGGIEGDEAAQEALPQTFVTTFADIVTQEPVGERGNFDPDTGDGSVVVPDIEPGLWAVAAACVGPSFDLGVLEAGIRAGAAFFEEIGAPSEGLLLSDEFTEFMQEFVGSDASGLALAAEFLGVIGPTLLEPIMVPDAIGAVLFCVLDAEGNCPADEPPPPPPGEPIEPEEPAAAQPVVAAPTFTG